MSARPARLTQPRPSLDDYLTDGQQDRLARVLVGVLVSAAETRAHRTPEPPLATAADDRDREGAS